MQSRSKCSVSGDAARAIVAAAFGPAVTLAGASELTEGFFNAAYLLELSDGRRAVLKVAPPPGVPVLRYERDLISAEVAALGLAAAHTAVPAPAVYAFDDSCRHAPSPYLLMSYVPGVSLHHLRATLPAATQAAIDQALGRYLGQLNAIVGPAFGYLARPAPAGAPWPAVFLGMLRDVLADGEALAVPLPLAPEALLDRVAAWSDALAEVGEPRLVHWDVWDGNVLVDPAAGQVGGIIDFERALWGDPLMEHQFRTFSVGAAFGAGYGALPLAGPGAHRRRVLYNLYLYLIMVIECTYRQYPTDDQERWARDRLAETLAQLA